LLPVYDKPMVYYPLSTLLSLGISEVLIVTTPRDQGAFTSLLGDGSQLGCSFSYAVQTNPNGLAEAFLIGANFIGNDSVALILGDNLFYGNAIQKQRPSKTDFSGGLIFGMHVQNPKRYGIVELDDDGEVKSIEEKPNRPKSNLAIPGLYFFDHTVLEKATQVKPSARGELEITDIHNAYWKAGKLGVTVLEQGTAWLDTGTVQSLSKAHGFVEAIQSRQGVLVGSPELAAYQQGFIDLSQLKTLAKSYKDAEYGNYLKQWINEQ
ncbi:MAG: sugar phosphate nucleotidyltransferase, partial [Bacteroidota bacterium]|nr:sugar phosphate nucleotidyltransferase [Bacteroidota bacterium]